MARHSGKDAAPVAIVGGGVVGLSMALALARQEIRSVIYERAAGPNRHPRAHVANPRTLEIFRLWGVEEQVRRAGLPPTWTGRFVWLTSLAGSRLGEVAYEENPTKLPARQQVTLTPEVSCAQDVIEQILHERLQELTGEGVRYGSLVTDIANDADGQLSVVVTNQERPVKARYVIAADGARSSLRTSLGIAMEGPDELARFASIYFHADLSPWTDEVPAVLYWIVNSQVQGVFISMDGHSRYVFHLRIDPRRDSFEAYTPDRCRDLLRDAVGAGSVEFDIRQVGRWIMSGQVAERYRCGDTFLVGDAAHRFPPTGGFGMNTGIQDAHNLAWKLAAVLRGWAPDSLLNTYEAERQPVADVNRSTSVSNFLRLEDLASWSLDPGPIITRLESDGPEGVAERARFRAEVERQRGHFDKLGQELGFVYETGALVPESTQGPHRQSSDSRPPVLDHFAVGARAPLIRLVGADGDEVASTDLFERQFVLFANETDEWRGAATRLATTGVPIRCLQIGRDLIDPTGLWSEKSGTPPGGAVLVRPDGHVAFRARSPSGDAQESLTQAVRRILEGDLHQRIDGSRLGVEA